jgi:pimeloyl-ACP methyl ester carboxylesterase
MGRTPASGWLLLRQLRRAGLETASFGYSVSRESFSDIAARLAADVSSLLEDGDLVLVGHSLGGVLLRRALHALPEKRGRVRHLFLLGSPVLPSRLASRLSSNTLFRMATQDCGRLLGSSKRMACIGNPRVPTTGIAGTRGVGSRGPFGLELNDGVVSVSEVSAEWLQQQVLVPVVHTLLPSSRRVGAIILETLARDGT